MKRTLSEIEMLRGQELLVQRATEGLDVAGAAELERLGLADVDSFDLAAAAIDVATVEYEDMPDDVADAIVAAALSASTGGAPATAPAVPAVAAVLPERRGKAGIEVVARPPAPKARAPRRVWPAWTAAAAAFALAVGGWTWALARDGARGADERPAVGDIVASKDVVTIPLEQGDGDVVWSPARSTGFLRLRNVPANDPARETYQVWIVDGQRDARYPVAAGLFDATGGEQVVRIAPQLAVGAAVEIFVTVEPPGGVVVSQRARIVARARVPSLAMPRSS